HRALAGLPAENKAATIVPIPGRSFAAAVYSHLGVHVPAGSPPSEAPLIFQVLPRLQTGGTWPRTVECLLLWEGNVAQLDLRFRVRNPPQTCAPDRWPFRSATPRLCQPALCSRSILVIDAHLEPRLRSRTLAWRVGVRPLRPCHFVYQPYPSRLGFLARWWLE